MRIGLGKHLDELKNKINDQVQRMDARFTEGSN